MTTAHRPTWAAALGGEEEGAIRKYAGTGMTRAKDLKGQTRMKFRQFGQAAPGEAPDRAALLAALETREADAAAGARTDAFDEERARDLLLLEGATAAAAAAAPAEDRRGKRKLEEATALHPDDADDDDEDEEERGGGARPGVGSDDEEGGGGGRGGASPSASPSDDEDDSDDDSDDEAALLAELDRIKAERAAAAAAAAAAEAAARTGLAREAAMRGNPLLADEAGPSSSAAATAATATPVSFDVARRWDEDVVFRHQARGAAAAEAAKGEFINDTVRSHFHRRFLDRYIR